MEVNGKKYHFPVLPPDVSILFLGLSGVSLVPVERKEEGGTTKLSFSFRFYNVKGKHLLPFDIHRDYGRSFLNDGIIPGEFAFRLLLPVKK